MRKVRKLFDKNTNTVWPRFDHEHDRKRGQNRQYRLQATSRWNSWNHWNTNKKRKNAFVAQLVEHFLGKEEVTGSIPVGSSNGKFYQ